MTPPGGYRRGTVGVSLPGVEVRRADDGELLVRGPYMMLGYDDPDEPERNYETEWFATGDLVKQDPDGYITIVDRKKDIYKNVKGQTIAPTSRKPL
jgi:long-subunit acyl-CoA synthetase (AMP-forming)